MVGSRHISIGYEVNLLRPPEVHDGYTCIRSLRDDSVFSIKLRRQSWHTYQITVKTRLDFLNNVVV
jgi:hypothetical protein